MPAKTKPRPRRAYRDYDSILRRFLTYKQANLLDMLEDANWLATVLFNKAASSRAMKRANLFLLLSRLRAQGLVESRKESNRSGNEWRITQTGKRKLALFRKHRGMLSGAGNETDYPKIVAFDIPERSKEARIWIRQALKRLHYKLLQKSVWIGDAKLPEGFFQSLADYEAMEAVHVFAISKRGSISDKYFNE